MNWPILFFMAFAVWMIWLTLRANRDIDYILKHYNRRERCECQHTQPIFLQKR